MHKKCNEQQCESTTHLTQLSEVGGEAKRAHRGRKADIFQALMKEKNNRKCFKKKFAFVVSS